MTELISERRRRTKLFTFAKHKARFDAGYGTSSYLKWGIAVVGLGSVIDGVDFKWLFIVAGVYGVLCYLLGWVMFNFPSKEHNFILAEREVLNQWDFFAKEVRAKIKGKLFK